jgi:hypothetical protein
MRCVPLGSVRLGSLVIWCRRSFWRSLREYYWVIWGNGMIADSHIVSKGVDDSGKLGRIVCKCIPVTVLSRYKVLVIGEQMQS